MIALWLGIGAFILYMLYDVNSIRWNRRFPRTFFMVGTVMLAAAMVLDLCEAFRMDTIRCAGDALLLLTAGVSFAALIYSLFFALPFDETYQKQSAGRDVYDRGVYALCRHPGILFFFGMYLFAGLAALPETGLILRGLLFSLLDLIYAWFQDRVTFPQTFSDYPDYRQRIPFLIPTKASLRLASQSLRHAGDEEVDP